MSGLWDGNLLLPFKTETFSYKGKQPNLAKVCKNLHQVSKSMREIVLWSDERLNFLAVIPKGVFEEILNSSKYQLILAQNPQASAKKQKMRRNFTFKHDSDPRRTSKSTKQWLHQKNTEVLERPGRSPDLNPVENVCGVQMCHADRRQTKKTEGCHKLNSCFDKDLI